MKQILKNNWFLFPVIAMVMMVSACQKEQVIEQIQDQVPTALPGKYRRLIELKDAGSSVTLGIASDNAAAVASFESHARLEAVSETQEPAMNTEITPVPAELATASDEDAIHICIINEKLAEGKKGFALKFEQEDVAAKVNDFGYYTSGYKYFYSFVPNHYFKVTPLGGHCVSAWLKQRSSYFSNSTPWTGNAAGTYCIWAGGSGGNYLCHYVWAASSTSSTLEYQLRTNGYFYSVYWY